MDALARRRRWLVGQDLAVRTKGARFIAQTCWRGFAGANWRGWPGNCQKSRVLPMPMSGQGSRSKGSIAGGWT
jgi:hypothetical protein